jgi:hypothetical protein
MVVTCENGKLVGPEIDELWKALHPNQIRFYRANGEFGFLSNLYKAEIVFEDRKFACSEYAYGFGKFRDKNYADWAITAPSPHLFSIIIHNLFAWDITKGWAAIKVDRMRQVLYAKFTQHPDLKVKLLETGTKILVEESSIDNFWGIGPKGKGKNMLGVLLMELRTQFQTEMKQ